MVTVQICSHKKGIKAERFSNKTIKQLHQSQAKDTNRSILLQPSTK